MICLFLQERSAEPAQHPILAQELLADTFQPPLHQLPPFECEPFSHSDTQKFLARKG
jgi:hypothetical protein